LHTDAISNGIDFTNFFSHSPHAVIRVYDLGGSNFPPQRFAEHTVREITFLEYQLCQFGMNGLKAPQLLMKQTCPDWVEEDSAEK